MAAPPRGGPSSMKGQAQSEAPAGGDLSNIEARSEAMRAQILDEEIAALNHPALEPLLSDDDRAAIRESEKEISWKLYHAANAAHGLQPDDRFEVLPLKQGRSWLSQFERQLEERCAALRLQVLSYSLHLAMGENDQDMLRQYLESRARLSFGYHTIRRLWGLKKAYLEDKEALAAGTRKSSYAQMVMRWQSLQGYDGNGGRRRS
ncbi:hypothetical protein H2202_000914 [Exophiala xenobiotica]|nr:hypothetical protein H2202_000914 [Exophiala xenobiotica]KAK5262486.1 hypothetical protein LTR40_000326 [Exophiala xenobiotica]KAK5330291.1 hypothetical protein LTR93_001880 [Exophiala xenobiotica]KAK5353405.1 hypothetical protein LTR61_003363 [Exophiala xenobiotica]KAK5376297.1 hypothetical protein LTS13_005095 [Exophiala xenobiotica]